MAINPPPGTNRPRQWGLFPIFPTPKTVEQLSNGNRPTYSQGIAFDFIAGEFILDGAGRFVMDNGYESWARWCIKTVLTERTTYVAYDRQHGVALERAKQMRTRAAIQIMMQQTIRQALKRDPRTSDVASFTFNWKNGDELYVSFVVTPSIGSQRPISVALDLGRPRT